MAAFSANFLEVVGFQKLFLLFQPWAPVIEGDFLPEQPVDMFARVRLLFISPDEEARRDSINYYFLGMLGHIAPKSAFCHRFTYSTADKQVNFIVTHWRNIGIIFLKSPFENYAFAFVKQFPCM